jgi:crotonobetainyl-CoA:carnitine CoA-transferase CaiB-like acyl-CoA transferase
MPGGPLNALNGLRVLDLSETVAGSYCTKLLCDAGADVIKVEPTGGHPLRRWSWSGSVGRDGDPDGALFRYLAAGQKSVLAELTEPEGLARILDLAAASDFIVDTFRPGQLEERGLGLATLHEANPALSRISITAFGQEGPRRMDDCSDFLLQAISGSLHSHGERDRVPLFVGGGLGNWIAGSYAAAGALAALARSRRTGCGALVDVSTLECLAVTLVCYPTVAASVPGGVRRRHVYTMVPAIEPCRDGFVGFTTLTVQQWHDFLALIGQPALISDHSLDDLRARTERISELAPLIHEWTLPKSAETISDLAAAFRIPTAPVLNGASITDLDHLRDRALFQTNPRGDFPHPRPPFRSTATSPTPVVGAPRLHENNASLQAHPRSRPPTTAEPLGGDPLKGVRVFDLTAFWAGTFATGYLASLGADVIKVESIQRPDAMRFNTAVPASVDQWYEQGYLFLAANLNKRGITLNLADPSGRDLALRLAATCDIVVENFSPRVVEQFAFTYDDLRAVRPDIIMLRMPGWGLEGPWRERPGFAPTMEQASGMAWVTGYEDGPPISPGLCDPLAGVHGSFAMLAALEHRRATGEGQQIELSMIDLAVNVAAEQLVEYHAYGHVMSREGNHGVIASPQGVYACAGGEEWVALAVSNDEEWSALRRAMGSPDWAGDPSLDHLSGRQAGRQIVDEELAAWFATRGLSEALAVLQSAGVPAEAVAPSYDIDKDPQMVSRGFWEEVVHPIVGSVRYPGWPMRISSEPERWYRSPAPLLGQHTEEVLRNDLGLTAADIDTLREAGIIGDRPHGL